MRALVFLFSILVAAVLHSSAATPAAAGGAGELPGHRVFMAKKCNLCHSIDALDVERTTKSEKIAGPDLSEVGKKHSAEWLQGWLRKQEKMNGKTHSREFKGTDEELDELVAWLAKLRG
jgi:cbb3-type cytochrome oxidase cytochrome c subunit